MRLSIRTATVPRGTLALGRYEPRRARARNAKNPTARVAPTKGEMTPNQFVRCASQVGCRTLIDELRPECVPPLDEVAREAERLAGDLVASDANAHRYALLLGIHDWASTNARLDTPLATATVPRAAAPGIRCTQGVGTSRRANRTPDTSHPG